MKTIVLSKAEWESIALYEVKSITLHGRKWIKILPESGQEYDEDKLLFTEPKRIAFRRRWTRNIFATDVRYIIADRSDRFDLKITIILK